MAKIGGKKSRKSVAGGTRGAAKRQAKAKGDKRLSRYAAKHGGSKPFNGLPLVAESS